MYVHSITLLPENMFLKNIIEAASQATGNYSIVLLHWLLKGQSREKVGELWVWSVSLGPN
jgi:hypothetical protein